VDKDFHLEVIQVKEEREQKHPHVGFRGQKPQGREKSYEACHTCFLYTSVSLSGDNRGYLWVREGKGADVHSPEKGKSQMYYETCWYKAIHKHMSL
jgi:hypothetical protein